MKVKRFTAPTMQKALRDVREAFGPDAVILSHQKVPEGVEIISALDYDAQEAVREMELKPNATPSLIAERQAKRRLNLEKELEKTRQELLTNNRKTTRLEELTKSNSLPNANSPKVTPKKRKIEDVQEQIPTLQNQSSFQEPQLNTTYSDKIGNSITTELSDEQGNNRLQAMQDELFYLRDLLEQQMGGLTWNKFAPRNPLQARLWKRFQQLGIDADVCQRLVKGFKENTKFNEAWKKTLMKLVNEISTFRSDPIYMGNAMAVVGPTGSGKTTTLGKLAAQFVMKEGQDSIGLISLDNFRIAAHEQFIAFGRILGVEVGVVDNDNSLDDLLERFKEKKLVLIDTAGYHINDPRFKQQYELICNSQYDIRTLLSIDCTGDREYMEQTYRLYEPYDLSGCIITKADECATLGGAVSLAIENLLSIAYVTFGQCIPDDIEIANGQKIVKRILEIRQKQETLDDSVNALHQELSEKSRNTNKEDDFFETLN